MPTVLFPIALYRRSDMLPANWLRGMEVKMVRHDAVQGAYRPAVGVATSVPLKTAWRADVTPGKDYSIVLTRKDGVHLFRSGLFRLSARHVSARNHFQRAIGYSVTKHVPLAHMMAGISLPIRYTADNGTSALRIDTANLRPDGAKLTLTGTGQMSEAGIWHDFRFSASFTVGGADGVDAHRNGPWPILSVRIGTFDYHFNNPLVALAGFFQRLGAEAQIKALFERLIAAELQRGVLDYALGTPDLIDTLRTPLVVSALHGSDTDGHLALTLGVMIHPAFRTLDLSRIGPRSR